MPFVARRQNKFGRRVGQAEGNTNNMNTPFDAQHIAESIAKEASVAVDQGDIVDKNAHVSLAADSQGNQILSAEFANGAQFAMEVPTTNMAESMCEFPAQALALQRQVSITNSTPQIVDVQTDMCGNVISYTENMTRNMIAGPWVPLSGLQGNVQNLALEGNVVAAADNPNIRFANSLSQPTFGEGVHVDVNKTMRVGKRLSHNAAYGASMMRKFRSA